MTGFDDSRINTVHLLLESFRGKPYKGNEPVWDKFMSGNVRLDRCYFNGVQKAIDSGRWRAKCDPIGYIRKVGQTAALNAYGVRDPKERVLADVGRVRRGALDPEQRFGSKNTPEYELRFDCPKKQARADAGPISGIGLSPGRLYSDAYSEQFTHEEKLEHLAYLAGDDEYGNRSRVPERLLLDPNYEHNDELPSVNWEMVAEEAELDVTERVIVLKYWSRGLSREQALSEQPDDVKRRSLQAAWKRLDRNKKWETIRRILRGVPDPGKPNGQNLENGSGAFRPPSEVLREVTRKARSVPEPPSRTPARYDYTGLVSW